MNARLISIGLLGTVIGIQPLAAQEVPLPNQSQGGAEAAVTSPSRLAAGLRAYPDNVVAALLTLADEPGLIRRLAEQPELLDNPERIEPPMTDTLKAALVELRAEPRIIAMAADHPAELEQLRMLHAVAPDGLKLRLGQLRENYERWTVAAAATWQRALEQDPVALGEYRELLTRLCREERSADPEFPYVHVASRDYYYVCVPNDLFVSFLTREPGFADLKRVVESWWGAYAPERVDEVAQGRVRLSAPRSPDRTPLAVRPVEARKAMWRPAGRDVAGAIGMVPVIMQPLADQSLEARREFALAEHARLWSPWFAPLPAPRAWEVVEAVEVEAAPAGPEVVEVVEWPEMRQVGVRTTQRSSRGGLYRSWYRGGGYAVGGVTLGYSSYGGVSLYGGYGGLGYYSVSGWPYSAGHTTYVEPGGLHVYYGPTTYSYRSPQHLRSTGGARRHDRSTPQRVSRGLRRYPSQAGRINGPSRQSPNTQRRGYRSTVPQRFRNGSGTIGQRRSTTIGTRGPARIGRRPSGYQRTTGIRRGTRTIQRSNPGVRTRSGRQPQSRRRR